MSMSSTATKTPTTQPVTSPTPSASTASQSTVNSSLQAALSARTRPLRANALATSLTFGWRALLKIKHVPTQLIDVTASPIMFTLLFTYLFGGAIAGSTGEYLQFLLPGILVQTIVFLTVYTGVALNTDITKGIFDRVRTLPVWRPSALVGALLGDVCRYTVASAITLGLGLLLGFRPEGGAVGVLLSVALLLVFAFGLSWVWTLLGLVMKTPESITGVSFLVILPLTFLSNIFVDPSTMPGWLEAVVNLNPITHLVTAVRGLMAGTATPEQVGWVLLSAALFTLVFAPLTMMRYNRRG